MFIRILVRSNTVGNKSSLASYPIRPISLIASVGIHCVVVACLLAASPNQAVSRRPIVEKLIQPKVHKIIMYDFRKKPPEVQPLKKSGEFPRPRGAEISKQAVIATSPKPKSTQQMIWLPTPKIEVQKDVPLPNLIARMKTALPSLPTLPKEKPQPVVEAAKAVQPNTSPPDPKGDPDHAPAA